MKPRVWLCLIFIAALTAGCAAPQSAAQPTNVSPTDTPAPTRTATATITPTATLTPTPTPTNTATLQPIPKEFTLLPQWQAGETRGFQRITTRSDRTNGQATNTNAVSDAFTINVLEANEAGYVLEWKLEGMDEAALAEDAGADMDALFASMNEAIKGMEIEYEADALGQITGLANLDEVRSDYETMQKTLLAGFENMGLDEETINMIVMFWDLLYSDEMIEASVLEGPKDYHQFYGLSFETEAPVVYYYSNASAGEAELFSYAFTFEVLDYDPENDQVQIRGEARLEGEQVMQMTQEFMDILQPFVDEEEASEEIAALMEDAVYSVEIEIIAELSTGWITTHKKTTTIAIGPMARVESVNTRMLDE